MRNFATVKDRMEVNKLSALELIKEAQEHYNNILCKKIAYYRLSDSGKRVMIFNKIGVKIGQDIDKSSVDLSNANHVKTKKQFSGNFAIEALTYYKHRIAIIYGYKVFANGNMPISTQEFVNDILRVNIITEQ